MCWNKIPFTLYSLDDDYERKIIRPYLLAKLLAV